jgi:hypothetical protein
MGAPELYPELYRDHLTGDPAYNAAFAALADCPSFAEVERTLKTYAHELAEKIRNTPSPRDPDDYGGLVDMGADWAADLIDPKKEN